MTNRVATFKVNNSFSSLIECLKDVVNINDNSNTKLSTNTITKLSTNSNLRHTFSDSYGYSLNYSLTKQSKRDNNKKQNTLTKFLLGRLNCNASAYELVIITNSTNKDSNLQFDNTLNQINNNKNDELTDNLITTFNNNSKITSKVNISVDIVDINTSKIDNISSIKNVNNSIKINDLNHKLNGIDTSILKKDHNTFKIKDTLLNMNNKISTFKVHKRDKLKTHRNTSKDTFKVNDRNVTSNKSNDHNMTATLCNASTLDYNKFPNKLVVKGSYNNMTKSLCNGTTLDVKLDNILN